MLIREETKNDYETVYEIVKKAFASAEHADGNEQDLVEALRKGEAYIKELSLVAEMDDKIVGHILFTKIKIEDETELALAPLAVLPEYQNMGVGIALIQKGHQIAQNLGYHYSIVLGSEKYYPKAGYIPAERYGIKAPFEVPTENFMAFQLQEKCPEMRGTVKYAKEFGIE